MTLRESNMTVEVSKQGNTEVVQLELKDLPELIDCALAACQQDINDDPNRIFNEADFERLLANHLEHKLKGTNFSVHTQMKGYYRDRGKTKYDKPDIVLLKDEAKYDPITEQFINKSDSVSIELKYLHEWSNQKKEDVKKDFEKKQHIDMGEEKTWLYVVVLMDVYDPEKNKFRKDSAKVTSIKKVDLKEIMRDAYGTTRKEGVYHRVLQKSVSLPGKKKTKKK